MATNNYISTLKPSFKPQKIDLGKIPAYQYKGTLKEELAAGNLTPAQAVDVLEDMLTIREFELLRVLVRGAGQVVVNEDILKEVWGEDPTGTPQTLQMHATWLRRKLGDDVDAPALLLADGEGYRLSV